MTVKLLKTKDRERKKILMRQKGSIEEEIQQIITAICLSTLVDAMRSKYRRKQ